MTILLAYFSIQIGIFAVRRIHPVRFDFATTIVWFLAILLNFFPPLVRGSNLSAITVILIILSHILLLIGYGIGMGRISGEPRALSEGNDSSAVLLLAVFAASFSVATVLSSLESGRVPILGALSQLQNARLEVIERSLTLSTLDQLAQSLKYPGLVFVMLLPRFILRRQWYLILIALAAAFSIADAGLRLGGRAEIVFMTVGIAGGWLLSYGVNMSRAVVIGVVGAVLFFFLSSSFVLARNRYFAEHQLFFTSRVCPFDEPGPWLYGDGSPQRGALALSLCYFASPIHQLDRFVADNELTWPQMWGQYSFGLIFRDAFREARDDIAVYYESRSLATNPWTTSIRDFWLDFGSLAPLAFFPLGFFIGRVSPRSGSTNDLAIAQGAILLAWGVMLPFMSPVVIPSLVYPLIVVLGLHWANQLGLLKVFTPGHFDSRLMRPTGGLDRRDQSVRPEASI